MQGDVYCGDASPARPLEEVKALEFKRDKFKELVLYVADKSVEDASFGATKLNKILFFSDFLAYLELGLPITGADYQKLEWGPAPRQMLPARRELLQEGAAAVLPRQRALFTQQRLAALREPDLSLFSASEIALVDAVIEQLRHHTAASVSEFSHRWSVGWEVAQEGELIPYETAFLLPPEVTEDDVEAGQKFAKAHGLLAREG